LALVLVDLTVPGAVSVAPRLRQVPGFSARLIGYGPHVDRELAAAALAAGFDATIARSRILAGPFRPESLLGDDSGSGGPGTPGVA
jgi:hypothetical protein